MDPFRSDRPVPSEKVSLQVLDHLDLSADRLDDAVEHELRRTVRSHR